jgi:hypothetical protein
MRPEVLSEAKIHLGRYQVTLCVNLLCDLESGSTLVGANGYQYIFSWRKPRRKGQPEVLLCDGKPLTNQDGQLLARYKFKNEPTEVKWL